MADLPVTPPNVAPVATSAAVTIAPVAAASGAATSVASSATSVNLLAANPARRGVTIYNDSTAILYVKLGSTASTSSYTVPLAAGSGGGVAAAYYEVPYGYTGAIDGIWASANGNARIVELT